jgi:hypothetical protein
MIFPPGPLVEVPASIVTELPRALASAFTAILPEIPSSPDEPLESVKPPDFESVDELVST